MSDCFMLDTDMCSFIIKGQRPDLKARLLELETGQICISAITRAELRFGLAKRPEAKRLAMLVEQFLGLMLILPWNAQAADTYETVRVGERDTMIAAHALAEERIVVTNNAGHFRQVNKLRWVTW